MNAVTIHKDHWEILKDYSDGDLGLLLRALMMDILEENEIKLPTDLAVIRKYIQTQNKRFSNQQSKKRTGTANKPKEPTPPNEPNAPTPPSVTESVSDTVTNTDTEVDNPPSPPQAGGKRGGKKPTTPKEPPVPKTKYAEFVSMTNDEHTSLVAKLGEQGTARCIEILDNYKGSKGKKYESDYRAILSWVITRYNEEQPPNSTENRHNRQEEPGDPWYDNARRAVDELRNDE